MSNIIPAEFWAIIVFAGQMLDMYTTRYALSQLGFREVNPLGRAIIGKWGFKGLQIFKSLIGGAILVTFGFAFNIEIIWALLAGASFFPVGWNSYWILRYR